jgi:YVTN family beta-propeller protein
VHAAIAGGITLFDMAPLYGRGEAEAVIGAAFGGRLPPGVRVTTKCQLGTVPAADVDSTIRRRLERSLETLRLDRVDIYAWDGKSKRLVKKIPLPDAPSHVWFSNDSRFVFVTLQDSNEIAAIEMATQTVVWKHKVGKQPAGILMTPDGKYLMVVIDWQERKTVTRIRTGRGAHNFRGMGDKRHLLVSNRVDNTVSIVDMVDLKVVGQIPVPGGPDCMDLSADGKTLWVTSRFAGKVSVVDMAQRKVVQTIKVGRSPHGIYLSARAPLL